ncbi:hypothetical protein LSUE1_G007431 [Lachnellula suecica]|uniref:Uncharacterized protein n=1 Tax=Lachnellula suecica TaxID=602035 RepID=A0A8T9BVI9_9HELO|nr:hypothetical protein LSUE1_G007431 [Lachnellula suecica]
MAFMAGDILALVSFVSASLFCIRRGVLTPSSPQPIGSRDMSPDAISPYSERPIRPLPKRRLRERLSLDAAESIKYPPTPKSTTPLFYPYNLREDAGTNGLVESQHPSERERADEMERGYITRKCGDELDSDEDEAAYRSRIYSRHSETTTGRSYRYVQKPDPKNPQPPASTASSADGYDSFENTNNKKKRKIPTPGDSNLNGTHLSSEMAGMGISGPDDLADDVGGGVGPYHSPGSAVSQGLSGPGRGRYGRIRNGRSPLRTLSDSNWSNGRTAKQRQQWPLTTETPGIISRSIADANAEKHPISPARGQENVSLLQQQASKKTTTASTQFTFTCDSQVPGTVAWPGPTTSAPLHHTSAAARMSTHATQTSPNIPASLNVPNAVSQAKQGLAASQTPHNPKQSPPAAAPKKTRRRTGKEYLIAARQRRQELEYRNFQHPPSLDDIWICEFCEYERIFGTPPEALIKQYEIKDRRIRKQEAERRRLLEKAKMKGRKGKKGNKAAAAVKNPAAAHDRQATHQQPQQHAPMNQSQSQSQGTQSEEYYEDEYDDEYVQDDPPPSPAVPPTDHHHYHHDDAHAGSLNHGAIPGGGGTEIPVA